MSDPLDQMYVEFLASYDSLDSAPAHAESVFADIVSIAETSSVSISDSLNMAGEAANSFAEMSQMAADNAASALENVTPAAESADEAFQIALQSLTDAVTTAVSQINEQIATIPAEAEDSATKSEGAFSGFSLGGMVQSVGLGIFAFQNMANMSTQLASGLLDPAMNAENMQASFTNLTGSAQAASDELSKLDAFAAKTQFTTMDIDRAGAQLLGFGFAAKDIIPDVQAVGDNLSAVGKGTPAEVQSVIDIFGKMSTQGKITAMDINQLGSHGIKALQDIAAGAGLSTGEIEKMIKNGTLPANEAIADLTKGIEKNPIYAGGMAKQSGTLSGTMSTLSSDWDVFLSKITSPALPELETGLGKLTTLLTDPSFQKFAAVVGTDMVSGIVLVTTDIGNLVSAGAALANFFKNNQTAMDGLLATLGAVGIGVMAFAITQIPAMIAGLVGWAIAQWAVVAPLLVTAAPFILIGVVAGAVIFGVIEAVQHWGAISQWLVSVWNGIPGFFKGLVSDVGNAFSGLGTFIHGVWDGIGGGIKWAINGVIDIINGFIEKIDSIGIDFGTVHIHANIPKIPHLSTGGYVPPGGVAIAGDPSPYEELVFGGTSGATVLSHAQSMAALSGGGGSGGVTHVHVYLDSQEIGAFSGQNVVQNWLMQGPVKTPRGAAA